MTAESHPGSDFEEVAKHGNGRGGRVPVPTVSFNRAGNKLAILSTAFESMEEPEAVRAFINSPLIGITPCDPDASNAYHIMRSAGSYQISAGWMKHELGFEPAPGHYQLEYDEELGLWVFDASDPDRRHEATGETL